MRFHFLHLTRRTRLTVKRTLNARVHVYFNYTHFNAISIKMRSFLDAREIENLLAFGISLKLSLFFLVVVVSNS